MAFAQSCRLVRRSEDHGRSWGPAREVGPDSKGNTIVDDNSGDVLVVCKHGYLYRSRDHGKTWKKEDIVIRPNAAGHGKPDGVKVVLGHSESDITLKASKHKGRLLMPARIQPPNGLLFERGKKNLYESIAVARFNLEWLTNGRDWRTFVKD